MPTFRERGLQVQAVKFTGDNYKIVETWGTATQVHVAQFLTRPGVPFVCIENRGDPYWVPVLEGHYIVKRADMEPFVMEGKWFEVLYEEVK